MRIKIIFILVSLSMYFAPAFAAELKEFRGPGIAVQHEEGLEGPARRLASDYDQVRTDVEMKLGWQMQTEPVIVLLGYGSFQKISRNELVTAFAQPGRNLVVIDYSKMGRFPSDLNDTLKHELAHLILHQKIGAASLPKWLDEGVAQWASGGVADIMYTGGRDLLRRAVLSDRLIPFAQLASRFPEDPNGLILSYEQSKSLTEFIVKIYGEAKLRLLLRNLQKNGKIEEAVSKTFGSSLDSVEQAWKKDLSVGTSWIAYAADHMTWVLFFLAALITVAGYLLAKRRLRNYRDDEDELEVAEEVDEGQDGEE